MNKYIKFQFSVLLLMLSLISNAQSSRFVIKLDTIYTNLDSLQQAQSSKFRQAGFKELDNRWLNDSGEEVFLTLAELPQPKFGLLSLINDIEKDLQKAKINKGVGSIIFSIGSNGQIIDLYFLDGGDKMIQNTLKEGLNRQGRWSPGIRSGTMGQAMYKLTVSKK